MERDVLYRIYVTETMRAYGHGQTLNARYVDLISREPNDTRTAEEIAADVVRAAGLTVKDGE